MSYCSLGCYKSIEHGKCNEALAQDNFAASLRNERADEEAKKTMLDVLKRFSSFDLDSQEDLPVGETSSLGFLGELTPEDVEEMSTEKLMEYIGPEALKRFAEDLKTNPKFIEAELKKWRPWWSPPSIQEVSKLRQVAKVPEPLEEMPPLSQLSKERPPEMLWNNLVELIYLYSYFYRLYAGDLVNSSEDFAKDYLLLSRVLALQQFAHPSVIHALRSTEASLTMETDLFLSGETKALLLDDAACILKSPQHTLGALADLQRVFERALKQRRREYFAAAKKVYFYNVWLNDEIQHDSELVATVLTSMVALVSGYKDRLVRNLNPIKEELAELRLLQCQPKTAADPEAQSGKENF